MGESLIVSIFKKRARSDRDNDHQIGQGFSFDNAAPSGRFARVTSVPDFAQVEVASIKF